MKVLVMSDSHGYISNAKIALDRNPEVKMVLHLGDYCRDATQLTQMYPDIKFEYVYGNCDIGIGAIPADRTIDIEGKKIFMTHGHRYSVKWDYNRILEKAESEKSDVILYGHTHIANIDYVNKFLIVNPGSISESRSNLSESYAILDISDGKVNAELYFI